MDCNIGRLLSIIYRKGAIYKNNMFKKINITAAEAPFLLILNENDGVSQECLSEHLSIDKASTARVVQSLISKDMVEKKKDENDKRVNRIYLTEKGKDLIDDIVKVMLSWNDILTEGLSSEEIENHLKAFNIMVSNIEKHFKKIAEKEDLNE